MTERERARFEAFEAEKGSPRVQQFHIAMAAYSGEGIPRDVELAAKLFRLAADQGLAEAQFNLAQCYAFGEGVNEDAAEAARLYRLAADQGVAVAQWNLAVCYEKGRGVPRNERVRRARAVLRASPPARARGNLLIAGRRITPTPYVAPGGGFAGWRPGFSCHQARRRTSRARRLFFHGQSVPCDTLRTPTPAQLPHQEAARLKSLAAE